jgi:hypothetical protein
MNILIIGDSFAADWRMIDTSYTGWPQLLAKKHSVTNLAQFGCGEYRILQQLKTQDNLDLYDWIIVCHTSAARIHTRQHPVHKGNQLHAHADLIFTDIEYHAALDKKQKNPALTSAHDFFIYHYDDEYYQDVHRLIVNEIHDIIGDRPVIVVDNFNQLNQSDYEFFLDFTKITTVTPGKINHCSAQHNLDICHCILDIIDESETILPDMVLKSFRLAELDYLLPDDPEFTKLDTSYPWPITYKFNSRGYRDLDWPTDIETLKNSIWCIGDSATMGIGAPVEHSWPSRLALKLNNRTINISMPGASNDWIYRQADQILKEIQPKSLVLQWSLLNRREIDDSIIREEHWQIFYNSVKDPSWPNCKFTDVSTLPIEIQTELQHGHAKFDATVHDEHRRIQSDPTCTAADDVDHTINLIKQLEETKRQTTVIHNVVPAFAPLSTKDLFYQEINKLSVEFIPAFKQLDLARDQSHWDIKTNDFFVGEVLNLINK